MSLVEQFTATRQVAEQQAVERATPKAWRPGEREENGITTLTTKPVLATIDQTERQLLEAEGYDPEAWMIVGAIKSSSWDVYLPKRIVAQAAKEEAERADHLGTEPSEVEWKTKFKSSRFSMVPRPSGHVPIDELIEHINKQQADPKLSWLYGEPEPDKSAWVHALGDLQIGKVDGDGPEGTINRVMQSIDEGVRLYLAAGDSRPSHVHIPWLGDCVEGFVSQNGRLAWRTSLTITEQVRVLRRLMLYAIDAYRPYAKRVTVVSVPGNHDEASSRQLATRSDDSWAIEAMAAVSDAISLNPDVYGHVECYVPGKDRQDVTMDVGGLIVTHVHGHQWRPGKVWDWWKGQVFGGTDSGQATLLLHGHFHHWFSEAKGDRMCMCIPALESESTWWIHATGERGAPSGLIFRIDNKKIGAINWV